MVEIRNLNQSLGHLDLVFGIYLRFGVWDLEFEV